MMPPSRTTNALHSPAVQRQAPIAVEQLRERLSRHFITLPEDHERLLSESDGLTTYGGYFRIFGHEKLISWNAHETWKFAWSTHVTRYLCFGETAWGDQYAYSLDDLTGDGIPPVYLLYSIMMEAEKMWDSLDVFLRDDFVRNSESPYDSMLVAARARIGDLALEEHITYSPSLLITGQESIEHVVKMPAVTTMIVNGDMASQLAEELQSRVIKMVVPFVDERGRMRLKVEWAD